MRKLKAAFGMLVLAGALAMGSSSKMNYDYVFHENGASAGQILVFDLAAVGVCTLFATPIGGIACGVATAL